MYDYLPKIIELDDLSPQGEPTIQIVRPGEYNKFYHVKTASEALDYIKTVKPIPGKTIILVLAMTAGEYYSCNRNGDAWHEKPTLVAGKVPLTQEQSLPNNYKTFETHATVFRHHLNKDKANGIGQVLKAFYNWPMHRVELLLALDNRKAEDVVERINNGEFVACSMGCKIPWDCCNICGNKAPSRSQYCDHARYNLGEILSNGKRVFVWNPSPTFFDISIVRRPADRIAFMMKKVAGAYEVRSSAELGERVEDLRGKIANLNKISLINKVVSGQVEASKTDDGEVKELQSFGDSVARPAVQSMPPIDDETIRSLIVHHPAEVLSTLSSMGIFFTTPEFLKYFVWKMDPSVQIPQKALDRAVAAQAGMLDALAHNPELLEEIEGMGFLDISPEHVRPEIQEKMSSWVEKRAQFGDYIYRHYVPYVLKGYPTRGNWDLVEAQDPRTGRTYQTTRGVANQTEDYLVESRAKNLLGGGALLGGALGLGLLRFPGASGTMGRALGMGGFSGMGRLVGGATLGAAAGEGARRFTYGMTGAPYLQAPTGERIYSRPTYQQWTMDPHFLGTEFVEKRSEEGQGNPDMHHIIRASMDFAHCPGACREKITVSPHALDNLDFDQAASRMGSIISP